MHRGSGRECFDADAGFDLFGPVHESVAQTSERARAVRDPRYDLFHVTEANFDEVVHSDVDAWATAWSARHQQPESTVRVETMVDADGVRLVRHLEIHGVRGAMQQTLTLPAYEDRVCFEAFFNKADETDPESLYFTFPFKLDRARAHFDTAGVSVACDEEQLPGACRDWFTAGSFVAVEGRGRGNPRAAALTLACPDAPLFQLGGFHYARRQRDVSGIRPSLVMAWATNNYGTRISALRSPDPCVSATNSPGPRPLSRPDRRDSPQPRPDRSSSTRWRGWTTRSRPRTWSATCRGT
ncbi:MAG: hypothetical protein U1G05_09340 [Kiritimatiellia bacterium]